MLRPAPLVTTKGFVTTKRTVLRVRELLLLLLHYFFLLPPPPCKRKRLKKERERAGAEVRGREKAGAERSQAAKHNRAAHPKKNVHTSGSVSYATHNQKLRHELERAPTFRELFNRTHKWKGTDDYISESARTIDETYDRTMADRYAEGTPQPDMDPEAWVNATGGPRKGQVYSFRDSLDTTPVLSSYASSVAPPAYASSSATTPNNGGEDMRTLIREELQLHFGAMVEQLISAIRGVGPSQQAPQVRLSNH
ncbi:hypothetical protein Taro_015667 [Colocasia esculenta]|uniref:Uncharacterized protein n=1 Tax=Colocasia esculenta TaxID=4460 RepID=A0A843UQK6_COLES|nr:hypothetical protein [Colocasia esculenta]